MRGAATSVKVQIHSSPRQSWAEQEHHQYEICADTGTPKWLQQISVNGPLSVTAGDGEVAGAGRMHEYIAKQYYNIRVVDQNQSHCTLHCLARCQINSDLSVFFVHFLRDVTVTALSSPYVSSLPNNTRNFVHNLTFTAESHDCRHSNRQHICQHISRNSVPLSPHPPPGPDGGDEMGGGGQGDSVKWLN